MLTNKVILSSALYLLFAATSVAETVKVYQGRYIATDVWAKTAEVSQTEKGEAPKQQGNFKMILERENWHALTKEERQGIKKRLVIKGVITGRLDMSTGYASHVMSNKNRTGNLYSEFDVLIPTSGDMACSTGEPLKGDEQINLVKGTGIYSNLKSGEISVTGAVNTCYGHPEFLQNNFELKGSNSYIEFTTAG